MVERSEGLFNFSSSNPMNFRSRKSSPKILQRAVCHHGSPRFAHRIESLIYPLDFCKSQVTEVQSVDRTQRIYERTLSRHQKICQEAWTGQTRAGSSRIQIRQENRSISTQIHDRLRITHETTRLRGFTITVLRLTQYRVRTRRPCFYREHHRGLTNGTQKNRLKNFYIRSINPYVRG